MSKVGIIALSGVVYRVKSTGAIKKPCGAPCESVTCGMMFPVGLL